MAKIILCTSKEASAPFTFLNTKVEIYTYEELCFYIYNNTILISKSMLSEKLFDWIRDEIGMEDLSQRLYSLVNKTTSTQDLLIEILSAGSYYSVDEIASYAEEWASFKELSHLEKEKKKADGYLGYRRYIKAATLYDDLIAEAGENAEPVFLGNIYHNRAVAAANNLDIKDAKTFFLQAYELNQNPESLRGYFYVIAVTEDTATLREEVRTKGLSEDYFEDILEEIENSKADVREMTIFAMLQRAAYNKMNKNLSDYDKRMDIILGDLKEDFREQTI